MIVKRLRLTAAFVAATLAVGLTQSQGGIAYVTEAPVLAYSDEQPVGASARLLRGRDWLAADVSTTGLNANAPYTVWWVIFNNPGGCSPDPEGDPGQPMCNEDDILDDAGNVAPNPLARASVLWASGQVANADGAANFGAVLHADEPAGQVLFGPSLEAGNGLKAEVHLVVRGHGPADLGRLVEQLNTFEGECAACEDAQFVVFAPVR